LIIVLVEEKRGHQRDSSAQHGHDADRQKQYALVPAHGSYFINQMEEDLIFFWCLRFFFLRLDLVDTHHIVRSNATFIIVDNNTLVLFVFQEAKQKLILG
jgi:hypothetical protein